MTQEITNPAPQHAKAGWALPRRLPAHVAGVRLNRRFVQWERATDAFLASPDKAERLPPVFTIKGGQSLGKTVAAIQSAKKRTNIKILYSAPTTKLSSEVVKKAVAEGIDAVLLQGRGQFDYLTKEPMCQKADEAAMVAALGFPVSTTLCRKEAEDGTVLECPLYQTCRYIKQQQAVKSARLIVAAHQYLSVHMDAIKDVDAIIIDESFWQTLIRRKNVDLGRFLTHRGLGKRFKGNRAKAEEGEIELTGGVAIFEEIVKRAFEERRKITLGDFRRKGFTGAHCRYLAGLECSRIKDDLGIDPTTPREEVADLLRGAEAPEALAFRRVWLCLGMELDTDKPDDYELCGLEVRYGVKNKRSGELQNVIACMWMKKPLFADKPALILDANADSKILALSYPQLSFFRVEAEWRNTTVRTISDWTGSMTALKNEANINSAHNTATLAALRLKDIIDAGETEEERQARRPVLFSTKALIDTLRADGSLKSGLYDADHCGNVRGSDEWKHSVSINMHGRIEPSLDELEDMGRCMTAGTNIRLQFVQPDENGVRRLPTCQHLIVAKNGSWAVVEVTYHPDPFIHRILLQIREAENMQIAARGRPVWRTREIPLEINHFSSIPLGIQPDEIWRKAEMEADRRDLMFVTGFMPDTAQDCADAYPDLVKSAGAFRTWLSRRAERALPVFDGRPGGALHSSINNNQTSVTRWLFVSFQRPLKVGSRAATGWVRHEAGDTPQKVAARLAAFLPDAFDIDVRMPAPTYDSTQKTREAGQPFAWIESKTVSLAYSCADGDLWFSYLPKYRRKSRQKNSLTKPRPAFISPPSL